MAKAIYLAIAFPSVTKQTDLCHKDYLCKESLFIIKKSNKSQLYMFNF